MQRQKTHRFSIAFTAALICLCLAATVSAENIRPGQIHDYPGKEAASAFKQHELSFQFPNDGLARAEFKSEEFYAIILKSAAKCSLTNEDRLQIQELFPNNKVFMDLFACEEYIEEFVTYTNTNPDYAFIAVFGGTNLEQAKQLFEQYDLATKFPGANIRKMQAVLVYS